MLYVHRDSYYNFFELNRLISDCKKDLQRRENVLKFAIDVEKNKDFIEDVTKEIKEIKEEIKYWEKRLNKFNDYKKITVEYDGDYDINIRIITFPIGTKMEFKKKWLLKNRLPIKNMYYHISSMYDCTGKVHTERVKYKQNKVIITQYLDL